MSLRGGKAQADLSSLIPAGAERDIELDLCAGRTGRENHRSAILLPGLVINNGMQRRAVAKLDLPAIEELVPTVERRRQPGHGFPLRAAVSQVALELLR